MVFPVLIRRCPRLTDYEYFRTLQNAFEVDTKYVDPKVSEDDLKFPKASPKYYCTFKT